MIVGIELMGADYKKHPDHWMKVCNSQNPGWLGITLTPFHQPLEGGPMTGLVEIPASWYLDDLPPMMFIKKAPNSHGWVNPRDVEELWMDQFNFFYREYDEFVFPVTVHPGCLRPSSRIDDAGENHRKDQHLRRRGMGDYGADLR